MARLTWLHLSDWHQRGPDFDRQVVRDALIQDIRQRPRIDPCLARIDFIIFSNPDMSASVYGCGKSPAGQIR